MSELKKTSTKVQVVIPSEIRKELGIQPNDTLQVERVGDLIVLKKIELPSLSKELKRGGRK